MQKFRKLSFIIIVLLFVYLASVGGCLFDSSTTNNNWNENDNDGDGIPNDEDPDPDNPPPFGPVGP
jgi:hypothetical protein